MTLTGTHTAVRRLARGASRRLYRPLGFSLILLAASTGTALAHVPYLERSDFSALFPFPVADVTQSIAVYSWIAFGGENGPATDVDFYRFTVTEPTLAHIESIVPVCAAYQRFKPSFALVGSNLPPPDAPLPFELPAGWGAIVMQDVPPGQPRETFFEPFGGKSYFQGPVLDWLVAPGTYYIAYWDPERSGGDYVAVIGIEERFEFWDIVRALIEVPIIRRNEELHVVCE